MQCQTSPQPPSHTSVAPVSEDWVTCHRRMATDLVGSTRLDADLQQRHSTAGPQSLEVSDGGLFIQRRGPCPFGTRITSDHCEIATGDATCSKCLSDALVCRWMHGEEHQPRGWRVESMVQCSLREARLDLRKQVILADVLGAL